MTIFSNKWSCQENTHLLVLCGPFARESACEQSVSDVPYAVYSYRCSYVRCGPCPSLDLTSSLITHCHLNRPFSEIQLPSTHLTIPIRTVSLCYST